MLTLKIYKTKGLLQKTQKPLTRSALTTISKAFIRPHPNYVDIIYDEA